MSPMQPNDSDLNHGLMLPNIGVPAQRLVEFGVAAEEAGWDGVFLIDQLVLPGEDATATLPDPWITLTGIAARTDVIRVGSYVTPVPRRQPWQLARDLATLDRLSDGRVIFGAGLGRDYDYTTFGRPYDLQHLGQKYDEALDVITGLWQGDPISYDGEHYTIDEAVMRPTPVQEPRIPIVIAGLWPNKKPFQRGARWDGIMPHYRGDGVLPKEGIDGLVPGADVEPEEDVRELLSYYHDLTEEPGEVFLPADPPHRSTGWLDLCKELGATWVVTRPRDQSGEWNLSMEQVRSGPPEQSR